MAPKRTQVALHRVLLARTFFTTAQTRIFRCHYFVSSARGGLYAFFSICFLPLCLCGQSFAVFAGWALGRLFLIPCGLSASFSQLFLKRTSICLVSQRQWELLAFLPFSASVTQGGAGSPPPLVEVNQAILAWSFEAHKKFKNQPRPIPYLSEFRSHFRLYTVLSV